MFGRACPHADWWFPLCAGCGALAAREPAATPKLTAEARNPRKGGKTRADVRYPSEHLASTGRCTTPDIRIVS
jgi:hypothetical protein